MILKNRIKCLVPSLILLCVVSGAAQDHPCELKLSGLPAAPELFGFQMGMSTAQLKDRVPQVIFGRDDEFGVAKTSISPDFDPRIDKTAFSGIRTVSFDFLDGRLISLWLGYDSTFKWKTVPDFVDGISQSLHLSAAAWKPWKVRGQQISCEDFLMTVSIVAEGPSFHIIDKTAQQTITERREAKDAAETAAEESESSEIIGDSKTRTYYTSGCTPSQQISNRVVFKTREEAEKAGYKLAKICE